LRFFQNQVLARLDSSNGSLDFPEMFFECGTMVGPEFENGDAPSG
jgi:hypothetical protein